MNFRQRVFSLLQKQSQVWLLTEAFLLVVIIGILDYATGYEVTFFPFYSIPILLVLWFRGKNAAIMISLFSAMAWWWADSASGHVYSPPWLQAWDVAVRMSFFYLVVVAGAAVRDQRDTNRARIDLLERSQQLEQEIISISEREQERIGRDLHDGLGQHLVAIGLAADSLKQDVGKYSEENANAVGQIANLLHDSVVRVRDLARGLSPVDSDEGGLESALEQLATSSSRLTGIRCSFVCDGSVAITDNTTAVHVFRIAQEAVNNAAKHGHAKSIIIALDTSEGNLALRVSDDGAGFPTIETASPGMGLNIMRYRARMICASLEIQPNSPTGTVVSCTVPVVQPALQPTNL